MLHLIGFISSCGEEVAALLFCEEVADMSNCLPWIIMGACGGLKQQRLELGEGPDRVQIGAEWRQEQEPGTDCLHGLCGLQALVRCEVVENDHIASLQCGDKLGFDMEVEKLPVHCTVDQPGGIQPIMAQGSNEGLGVPMAKGCMVDQALTSRAPVGGLDHVGLDRGLVDEAQPCQHVPHAGLAARDPGMADLQDVPTLLFKGSQAFFSCVRPRPRSARQTGTRCTVIP